MFTPPIPATDDELREELSNWRFGFAVSLITLNGRVLWIQPNGANRAQQFPVPVSMDVEHFPLFVRDSLISAVTRHSLDSIRHMRDDSFPFRVTEDKPDAHR